MDLASPLKPDVFRVVVVIVLPGLLATFPWLAWFFWPELLEIDYWREVGIAAGLFVLAIAMIAGMILEDIGAHIEVRVIDPYVCKDKGVHPDEFEKQWMGYLMTESNDRFVAHRYIRAMVTRFKFELSMIPACASVGVALVLSLFEDQGFDLRRTLSFLLAMGGLGYFFLDQARRGGWQLHELRHSICKQAHPTTDCPEEE